MNKRPKRPTDINLLARQIVIVEEATGGKLPTPETPPATRLKNPAAVELGRLGGLRGGKARASKLSPERRQEIARMAAMKRWHEEDKS